MGNFRVWPEQLEDRPPLPEARQGKPRVVRSERTEKGGEAAVSTSISEGSHRA